MSGVEGKGFITYIFTCFTILMTFPGISLLLLSLSVMSHSFATPWTVALQAFCPRDFPGKNTRVGCHFLLQGIELVSPAWQADFFTTESPGKPWHIIGTSNINWIVVVQLLRHVGLFATPWTAACQASLSFTISLSLLKVMSTESVMPSNHLFLSCSLLLCLQSFPASWSFPISRFSTH